MLNQVSMQQFIFEQWESILDFDPQSVLEPHSFASLWQKKVGNASNTLPRMMEYAIISNRLFDTHMEDTLMISKIKPAIKPIQTKLAE